MRRWRPSEELGKRLPSRGDEGKGTEGGKTLVGCKAHHGTGGCYRGSEEEYGANREGWPPRHSGCAQWLGLHSKSNGKPLQELSSREMGSELCFYRTHLAAPWSLDWGLGSGLGCRPRQGQGESRGGCYCHLGEGWRCLGLGVVTEVEKWTTWDVWRGAQCLPGPSAPVGQLHLQELLSRPVSTAQAQASSAQDTPSQTFCDSTPLARKASEAEAGSGPAGCPACASLPSNKLHSNQGWGATVTNPRQQGRAALSEGGGRWRLGGAALQSNLDRLAMRQQHFLPLSLAQTLTSCRPGLGGTGLPGPHTLESGDISPWPGAPA